MDNIEIEDYKSFNIPSLFSNPIIKIYEDNKVIKEYYMMKNKEEKIKVYEKIEDKLLNMENADTVEDFIFYMVKMKTSDNPLTHYISFSDKGHWEFSTRDEYIRFWYNKIVDEYNKGLCNERN